MTRYKRIAEFMNGLCKDRHFKAFDAALINNAIEKYTKLRMRNGIKTRKTKENLEMNNRIVAEMLEDKYKPEHIKLYKKCRIYEYEYRTGKSGYGWKPREYYTGRREA